MDCHHICNDRAHTGPRGWSHKVRAEASLDPWRLRCPQCCSNQNERDMTSDSIRSGTAGVPSDDSQTPDADVSERDAGWSSDSFALNATSAKEAGDLRRALALASIEMDEITEMQVLQAAG